MNEMMMSNSEKDRTFHRSWMQRETTQWAQNRTVYSWLSERKQSKLCN